MKTGGAKVKGLFCSPHQPRPAHAIPHQPIHPSFLPNGLCPYLSTFVNFTVKMGQKSVIPLIFVKGSFSNVSEYRSTNEKEYLYFDFDGVHRLTDVSTRCPTHTTGHEINGRFFASHVEIFRPLSFLFLLISSKAYFLTLYNYWKDANGAGKNPKYNSQNSKQILEKKKTTFC